MFYLTCVLAKNQSILGWWHNTLFQKLALFDVLGLRLKENTQITGIFCSLLNMPNTTSSKLYVGRNFLGDIHF